MNEGLMAEVSDAEIKTALFSIGPTRAPGPDGFNAAFYQHFWTIVGPAIATEVRHFFKTGIMQNEWNHTNLCLIPKITEPKAMKDLRPISLCNVTYKIISKILTKRLKSVLPNVVSESQAAFIPGRYITDNVLIAHEVLHSLRVRKRCATSYMAVKTDISKAYDRIEWSFLEEVLIHKGFHTTWIKWIMSCVRSVSFSVIINGSPYGSFRPTRGIRQATREGRIQGIQISNGGPRVSHLFFADDSLFFVKADHRNSSTLLKIFKEYEDASGQMINLEKSSITFGNRVYHHNQGRIKQTLLIPNSGGGELDSLIANFWWGSTKNKRKLSWIAWKKLITSKQEGGLGFRAFHSFNQALLANQIDDEYLWSCTTDGHYTVKSGYWKALDLAKTDDTPKAPLATRPYIAKSIWNLDIAPKLKHFLWRIASGAIGVAENLRRRNIMINPYCSSCCYEEETSEHILFSCPNIAPLWRSTGIPTPILRDSNVSLEEKLRYLFHLHQDTRIPKLDRYTPFWLMWHIWKSRNSMVFNKKQIDQNDTKTQAFTDTKEWLNNTEKLEQYQGNQQVPSRHGKWKPPDQRWVKCNFDASHHEGNRDSGLG
ncbi:PREDICTED: uncharacterized protein LOC104743622 [Camelina sativa]|uniref:Uncharacterized protein LOC104743622 n=1 Tax=Camelina sativa TaxID=90675 RepID=A0ABM0VYA8_CAMSA|nr:PREDICTED: uncharacterized protein LOC104743622 [Camelina sativa]